MSRGKWQFCRICRCAWKLSVIDRQTYDGVYPMEQFVEAAQYVESQQKVGSAVLRIA